MMQIVIDIPDSFRNFLLQGSLTCDQILDVYRSARNGVILPKGHGDLKDMNDIYEALEGWDDDTGWIVDAIDYQTQTIVEADAESEE